MLAKVNMAHLLTQPHQNYNHHSEPSEIRIEKKSDIYEIKETTSVQNGRWDTDMEWAGPSPTCGGKKFRKDILGARSHSPTPGPPPLRFQCQEDKSPQLLATKPSRYWVSGRNFWSPKQFLLKNPHMDLLRLIPFELLHQGSSLKGTSGIRGVIEVSGMKERAGGHLSPRQQGRQWPLSLS